MRAVLVVCGIVAGCHATTHAPPRPVAPIPVDPPPVPTLSFLERTSPRTITVPHADVVVARRDGPEAVDALLPAISERVRECYTNTWLGFGAPQQDHLTITIDARAGETSVEIEPAYISSALATCFVKSLVSADLYAPRARVVLAIDSRLWFTVQPP